MSVSREEVLKVFGIPKSDTAVDPLCVLMLHMLVNLAMELDMSPCVPKSLTKLHKEAQRVIELLDTQNRGYTTIVTALKGGQGA